MNNEKAALLKKKGEVSDKEREAVTFDLEKMYSFDPNDAVPEISPIRYSNLAYIHVSQRDVYIDFLEMPGVKREGKVLVPGTRIYMSHVAAKKLAETLSGILEKVHADEGMEKYIGKENRKTKSD